MTVENIDLLDWLIDAGQNLSGSALQLLLVYTRECLVTGGDSVLTLEEAAKRANISTSSAQKQTRVLAENGMVRRIRFGRNTHIRVLGIPGLVLQGQEYLPLPPPAANTPDTAESQPPPPAIAEQIEAARAERDQIEREWTRGQHDPVTTMDLANRFSQLSTLIERLEAQVPCPPPDPTPSRPRTESPSHQQHAPATLSGNNEPRKIPQHLQARIRATIRRCPGISSPSQLFDEIRHQVENGVFQHLEILHAVNICLKLIRENRWTTPWDYAQKQVA
ncbi:hypothetical protein [Thiolapillus sp.]|uniref:hypothetical protein n=5 Tax=Thiolapillus sp. TaxID=2017437 RepID=UPI0025F9E40F|nr:hypothetical protein [Thiolapillus sp.]